MMEGTRCLPAIGYAFRRGGRASSLGCRGIQKAYPLYTMLSSRFGTNVPLYFMFSANMEMRLGLTPVLGYISSSRIICEIGSVRNALAMMPPSATGYKRERWL